MSAAYDSFKTIHTLFRRYLEETRELFLGLARERQPRLGAMLHEACEQAIRALPTNQPRPG